MMTLILQTVHRFFDQQVPGLHQDFNEWRSRLRRTVVGMAWHFGNLTGAGLWWGLYLGRRSSAEPAANQAETLPNV